MNKNFDYLYVLQAQGNLEVEDIGNVCIHVLNDSGYEWYLLISTELGDTTIKTFGPFHVDMLNYFSTGFKFEYYMLQYSESKICTVIDKFINDNKKITAQAFICEPQEAYDKLRSINFEEMR